MPYAPYRKGTLLIPSGSTGNHLFFILTNACAEGDHLLVNISSVPEGYYDDTCILSKGDHPFVRHDSFVVYRMAERLSADKITRMVEGWLYKPHDDAPEELVKRMESGIAVSEHTPQRIVNYYNSL